MSLKLRRTTGYEQVKPNLVREIDLSKYITERGFYSILLDLFKGLSQGDMDHVKIFNKKLKKKREDADPSGKRAKQTPSIRNRRFTQDDTDASDQNPAPTKRRRKVEFMEKDEHILDGIPVHLESDNEGKEITQRRRGITFRLKK